MSPGVHETWCSAVTRELAPPLQMILLQGHNTQYTPYFVRTN